MIFATNAPFPPEASQPVTPAERLFDLVHIVRPDLVDIKQQHLLLDYALDEHPHPDDVDHQELLHFHWLASCQSNVPNGACKNPPKCDQCIDGCELACTFDPNEPCQCQWQSGCRDGFRYGICETLYCSKYYLTSFSCDTDVDPKMYLRGYCYCRDAPCRVENCPPMDCGTGQQAVCDPNVEEEVLL
ncbi:hypothetical protein PG994_002483 [Apiospora phragmitis]|uniref:Uncharacterized protein n=1 Tax=Apiospora phragmitis TaxID=2905665 RepID=A0ABR1WWG7_9PEZI